jgi:hypothetical protein
MELENEAAAAKAEADSVEPQTEVVEPAEEEIVEAKPAKKGRAKTKKS